MQTISVRYKPSPQEKEMLDEILEENPFFEGCEVFKFLLGFYKQNKRPADYSGSSRLKSIAKSFDVKVIPQSDDDLINSNK